MFPAAPSLGALFSLALPLLVPPVRAQFPRLADANLTQVVSPVDPRIRITFKEPHGACKAAFPTQKQYTGWVNVPGSYPTNIFFWFVAARQPTSLLTIWLNGGPGSSSMFGMFTETGPCEVIENGADRLETAAREWGWDRASNMLFIDQPNQVGFSYDVPTDGTLDLETSNIAVPPRYRDSPLTLNGTFSSQKPDATANTTEIAATAIYHMMQGFLATFPQYNPPDNSSLGVNLFAESYGGKYGPVFADVWEAENERRQNGTTPPSSSVGIHLTSLGIVNGCVDDLVQGPYYASMLVNNSYGIQALPPLQATLMNNSFYQPGGCRDLINRCRAAAAAGDPESRGTVASVNLACRSATNVCSRQLYEPYSNSGLSFYDIASSVPESFPPRFYVEYLNTASVQTAVGVPINYTDLSRRVYVGFRDSGDFEREDVVPKLARLLRAGIRVGLMYGDRDYICNWLGGEAISLAVAAAAGAPYQVAFPAAGYAPIIVNDSYIGGAVRQFANLSFSRVYQAGHFVPASQPETAFQIFARIVLGTSVSTGAAVDLAVYNTSGPANATSSLKPPPQARPTCFVRALGDTCDLEQTASLAAGEGVVINGAWYAASSDWAGARTTTPPTDTAGGSPTQTLTGLFTATSTPNDAGGSLCRGRTWRAAVLGSLTVAGVLVAGM